jgi:iron complex transport system ATP-binding protein
MSLRVSGVDVTIAGHRVLSSVDLEVRTGELLALVGPNGAGKTTLLHVLSGDLVPHTGTVELDGQAVAGYKVRNLARRRAVLPQEQRLAFGFRVVDVVRMGRAPWTGTDAEDLDDEVVADAMTRTDVLHLAERTFPTLSGGEKSRTSLARVVSQATEIVLLDEPTAALDIRHAEQVLTEARRLARAGHAVVAVLHDLSIAAAHADRICVLAQGSVRADGPPAEVLRPDLLADVYGHPVDVITHRDRLVVIPHTIDDTSAEEASCTTA